MNENELNDVPLDDRLPPARRHKINNLPMKRCLDIYVRYFIVDNTWYRTLPHMTSEFVEFIEFIEFIEFLEFIEFVEFVEL